MNFLNGIKAKVTGKKEDEKKEYAEMEEEKPEEDK
jgi:hypothetical protein